MLNLLGSLTGVAWRVVEDFDISKAEDPDSFDNILKMLDKSFQYDSKVEMPADFSAYFESLSRKPGQTLLQFITEHDERLRKLEKHGVVLPDAVQGWHVLHKAMLTKEQKQLVMTQANSLARAKIQESLFSILGQDYKSASGQHWNRRNDYNRGKGRAYYEHEHGEWEEWAQDDAYYEADGEDGDWFAEGSPDEQCVRQGEGNVNVNWN